MTPTLAQCATDYAEALEFKRIATKHLGEKCEDYDADCMCCQAHRIADIMVETALASLKRAKK